MTADVLLAVTQPNGRDWRALPCTEHPACVERLVGSLPSEDEIEQAVAGWNREAAISEVMRRWRVKRALEGEF